MTCSCIYTAHCDDRAGCVLAAGATVNDGGGICRRRDDSTASRGQAGACGDAPAGDDRQGPQRETAAERATDAPDAESDARVGVGPVYAPVRDAARALAPVFQPPSGVPAQPHWGVGLGATIEPAGADQHALSFPHPVCSRFEQVGNSLVLLADLVEFRATAITLLAYCEAHPDE